MGGPGLPPLFVPLRVEGLAQGPGRIDLEVSVEGTSLEGVPPDVEVRTEPFRPAGDWFAA